MQYNNSGAIAEEVKVSSDTFTKCRFNQLICNVYLNLVVLWYRIDLTSLEVNTYKGYQEFWLITILKAIADIIMEFIVFKYIK